MPFLNLNEIEHFSKVSYPRDIIKRALELNASGLIFVHNHPSGDIEPSKEDIALTKRLVEAGKISGIEIIDHIIVSRNGHFSFQAEGMLEIDKNKEMEVYK